ncbi:biopolymer transporter ExbD [Sphaerochaeta globosa]|uniref:Biopolymer transport protein ExbD/TolR n=1 Tax=Sphaerochaeta globosa (strain ATCC BAA-1886 / DSM 22777 / Buddy) TaxID=158189 RepID=F0RY02_SPHGB|nr:biopolymer transporter ExbD [Sphaerochaeta globosa]ADY12426.1 Biopolymer transport protein ExbD/TolR [Sphaerochaeta globosa str. Buddy]
MRKRKELGQSSDIAFLLIIFFLLLSGVAASHSLELNMSSSAILIGEAQDPLELTLKHDGTLLFQDRVLQNAELTPFLNQEPHLSLAIEAKTDWQTVVSLMSLLEQYPLSSLSLEVMP